MNSKLIITALCVAFFCSTNGFAASFSCEQASNTLERTICTDSKLSKADEEMAKYYDKLKESLNANQFHALLSEQRAWLKQRVEKCPANDALCLQRLYSDRIHRLRVRYENLVPFVIDDPGSLQGLRCTCAFHDLTLPEDLFIYAAGTYSGRKLNVQIDKAAIKRRSSMLL